MNKTRQLLRGTALGALASLILWFVLAGTILFFRRTEQDFYILVVGIGIWSVTWAIAGLIISAVSLRNGRVRLAGTVSGLIIGVLSVVLMFLWPVCSYESVIDKTSWAIPYALLTPILPILFALNWLLQHVISGYFVDIAFALIAACAIWGSFGAMLGQLIGRSFSLQRPLPNNGNVESSN